MVTYNQFEGTDDPLDKTTTAEAIRTLTEFYRSSQFSYSAREKVEEMSKLVGVLFHRVNLVHKCICRIRKMII